MLPLTRAVVSTGLTSIRSSSNVKIHKNFLRGGGVECIIGPGPVRGRASVVNIKSKMMTTLAPYTGYKHRCVNTYFLSSHGIKPGSYVVKFGVRNSKLNFDFRQDYELVSHEGEFEICSASAACSTTAAFSKDQDAEVIHTRPKVM